MRCKFGLVVGVSGCILPAIPPPSHYNARAPVSVLEDTRVEVGAGIPAANIDVLVPLRDDATMVLDFGGQGWIGGAASFSSGVWFKTDNPEKPGALRLGASAGMGDLMGFSDLSMPYVGPALHYQRVWASSRKPGRFTTGTFGVEMLIPVFAEEYETSEFVFVVPVPGFYLDADLRRDFAVGANKENAVFIAGGVRFLYWVPIPVFSTGLRF